MMPLQAKPVHWPLAVLPNLLTLARVVLVPFVAVAILQRHFRLALLLFFLAGISDLLDGFMARKFGGATRLGAYLDPLADKLLLTVIYVCLAITGAIPVWMVVVVIARDVFILGMVAWGMAFTSVRRFPPTLWGKLSTFLQIGAALLVLGAGAGLPLPDRLGLWIMILATMWSGIDYAHKGLKMLRADRAESLREVIDGRSARG